MQTFCFLFVRPTEVEGVADIADDEARDKRMLDIARDEHAMIGWSSLRIRGPEMDRILATLERIFAFEPDALAQDLIAGRFPWARASARLGLQLRCPGDCPATRRPPCRNS